MKTEYIIEKDIINSLYANTYKDIAFDLTKELDNPIIMDRITFILNSQSFGFSPITLKSIHKALFNDVYAFAGHFKSDTVEKDLFELFKNEKNIDYSEIGKENILKHIINFHYRILSLNPFIQGNSITITIFLLKYLQYYGFILTKKLYNKCKIKSRIRIYYKPTPWSV